MHDQGTPSPDVAFLRNQQAVMSVVLGEFPAPLTFGEIVMEVERKIDVQDAVRDLTAAGLLHREGELVFATRAARRLNSIEQQ